MSTADDDKTLAGPPTPGPPRAGVAADDAPSGLQADRGRARAMPSAQPGHTLPPGARLRDYEITGLIGEGGFGIVYLAWDHSLQRRVAIKEYMPASMAARVTGSSAIVVKSERHLDTFRAGLRSFVNEARLLARFDHPSLVKVYRFWEENGTAYMVMPYYEGPTLKAALAELGRPPREDELRAWLRPLLDALAVMHSAQCYHRDIAPDNILLTPRGPLLLDFGAARRVIGDMTHAITVVLKPGYAPIEQYGDVASMAQGAWTDLYALACVVYYAIAGRTPTSSVERLMDDRLEPLAVAAAGRYRPGFLRAIDAALAVRPGDRPQTEREFRALLDADLPAAPPVSPTASAGIGPYTTVPGTLTPEITTAASERPDAAARSAANIGGATIATVPTVPTVPTVADVPTVAGATSEEATIAAPPETETGPELPAATADVAPIDAASTAAVPFAASAPVGADVTAAVAAPSAARGPERRVAGTLLIGVAALAVVSVAALFVWQQPRPGRGAPSAAAASAVAEAPAGAASAPWARTLPEPIASPGASAPLAATLPNVRVPIVAAPAPVATLPPAAPSLEAAPEARVEPPASTLGDRVATPLNERGAPAREPEAETPSAPARSPRPRREPAPRPDARAPAVRPPPSYAPTISARCSDILQKASLEPLTEAEAAYLKRECR